MLINDHFIFVHLPKTGGTWIREVMHFYKKFAPIKHSPVLGHVPLSKITHPPFLELPALCFVRNPWDWYYSAFMWQRHNLDGKGNGWALPREHWGEHLKKQYEETQDFETFVHGTMSLTERYHSLTDHDQIPVHTKRMEDGLAEGFLSFLTTIGVRYDPALVSYMDTKLPANRTPTRLTRRFAFQYSKELKEIVQQRDAELIERFNYKFEDFPC